MTYYVFLLSLSPLFPPVIPLFLFFVVAPALLHQQGQPAAQQRASGCPSQQRPPARDAHPRLPAGPRLSDDDDPRATVALPKLAAGPRLLHPGTGTEERAPRRGRGQDLVFNRSQMVSRQLS